MPDPTKIKLCVILLATLLVVGCGPLVTTPDESKPKKPDVTAVETKWTLLADSIDNEKTLPKNSTQLSLMLTHLRSLGKITDQEVAAVKACVPGIETTESLLTKSQSDAIRGLK